MKRDPRKAIPRMLSHNAMCNAIIKRNEGRIVKELGDGIMVVFANVGKAVSCAVKVIQNLRAYGGGICTKVTIGYGALWYTRTKSGKIDVYGTPVHVSSRMGKHAVVDTIIIDEKDKESVGEWLVREHFHIRRLRMTLKDYPGRKIYAISFKWEHLRGPS